jgi:hypothetical protein
MAACARTDDIRLISTLPHENALPLARKAFSFVARMRRRHRAPRMITTVTMIRPIPRQLLSR